MRDLLPEMNRLASIAQSLNLAEVDHALQREMPENMLSTAVETPTVDEVVSPGVVNNVVQGGGYKPMPIGELRQQAVMTQQIIQMRLDQAGLNQFQSVANPKTATEILQLVAEQGNVILPRLANRGLLKQDGAEMIIKQVIDLGESQVKLDGQTWDVSKLKGEYAIEWKFSFNNPQADAARQTLAVSQRGLIPDRDIRVNTLLREDWEKDEDQLRWEEAERISPLIKLNRTRLALGKAAENGEPGAELELMMVTIQMIPALKQAMEGLMTPTSPQIPEVKPSQPMLPLTQGGGSARLTTGGQLQNG